MNDVNIPKTARGQETMERICSASEELFSEKGYYNTSITEIAQKANVAPGTVYIYFKDKKSIFRYLVEDLSYKLRKEIAIATKDCQSRYEEEYLGFRVFLILLENILVYIKLYGNPNLLIKNFLRNTTIILPIDTLRE